MTAVDRRGLRLDLRLVPAALTSWAVTAAGILWPVGGVIVALLVAMAVTVGAAACGSGGRGLGAAVRTAGAGTVGVLLAGLGFAVAVQLRVDDLRHHPIVDRYGTVAAVIVTPSESPRSLGGGRMMFRGSLRFVGPDEMSGRVVVFTSVLGFGELTAGQPAAFTARITRPSRRDLTVAVLSATGEPTLGEAAGIQRAAHRVRTTFTDAARSALPTVQAAMLPALVLGDTSALTSQTTAEFRASGLTHLTAVSGANVTIVCGAVLLSAGLVGPRVAVALAAVALIVFVVVVQPSASVLRAAVMGGITLLAMLSHRRRQALPALSATVIVLMIAAPELAVDVGFALSVSATAALIVIAPAWSRRLVGRGWPKPLADAVSVAVAAQLVTAPLVAAISGTVSVVAVAANLAVTAVIIPITVVGTAAAALSALWPAGAELLIRFTGPELWWLLKVAHWAAGVPGASVPVPAGPLGAFTVAGAGLAAVMLWRWRWVRLGLCGVAVCLLGWTVSGLSASHDTIGW
ncbi:MAG: ComEC/Rec2 family competence protein [Mycobacterium sp.]